MEFKRTSTAQREGTSSLWLSIVVVAVALVVVVVAVVIGQQHVVATATYAAAVGGAACLQRVGLHWSGLVNAVAPLVHFIDVNEEHKFALEVH